MALKFFLLAGEASGDMHGAKLIEALKAAEPGATFVGMGGLKMAAAGLQVAKDLDGMQVVGFWEVAKQYGFFRKVFYQLLDRLKQEKPDALVCVDYPGFNVRFAKEVAKLGIPCLYYIVPQVWAWKPRRVERIAEIFDRAFCVFEFEPPFFNRFSNGSGKRKMKTTFVGHPLLDSRLRISECGMQKSSDFKTVSFLPGSRESEILSHVTPMMGAIGKIRKRDGEVRSLFSMSGSTTNWTRRFCADVLAEVPKPYDPLAVDGDCNDDDLLPTGRNEVLVGGKKYASAKDAALCDAAEKIPHASLLPAISDFSVVKSGTSTLEAGLQGNPMCVVYKVGSISYSIARLLVNIPVFSLVNIVLGKYAVPELLQEEVNPQRIAAEIERGLNDRKYIDAQRAALAELPGKLGGPGASARAAQGMLDFLRGRSGA